MLTKQSQRYQKTQNLSATIRHTLCGSGVWLALSLGLVGCAGAGTEAPAVAPNGTATARDTGSASVPDTEAMPTLLSAATEGSLVPKQVAPPSPAEQALIDAREAMQKKQWARLAGLVPLAQQDALLGSYAQYWLLRHQVQNQTLPVPTNQLQQFMATNTDDYLSDRMKGDWIVAATRSGDYAAVNQLGAVVSSNAQVDCSRLMAQHLTGQPVTAEEAMKTFAPVSACWSMLDEFQHSNIIGWKQLEPLLRATLETSKTGHAQRIAALMFSAKDMTSYAALMKDPKKWLSKQTAPKSQAHIELVTLALSRMARSKDRVDAANYVKKNWASVMPKAKMQWVWGQFGLVAALNVESQAAQWYRLSGNIPMTDYNNAWQVRSELRQAKIDWAWVSKAIQKMSAAQQAESVWMYWYGRALAAQGNHVAATKYFASIQNKFDFYGQLANEELKRPIPIPAAPAPVTAAELAEARSNKGLQRAIRMFDLGWRSEAVPEWNFSLRGMSDRQLLAAAELARQERIYDRVVNTSLQTKSEVDFRQRFIAPFEGRVTEKARLIDLDPAWVYGLIRQESRFIMDARSRVGASGLMQLMPATARWVARKIGMKDFTPSSVNDFDTNTILGTNYLSLVLNQLNGSQVLATAGYNAGPGRSVQWRAKLLGPVEGAIFAETIPFTETRLYVKHVLSNAVYYAALFSGKPQSLKARLGVVSPSAMTQVALP